MSLAVWNHTVIPFNRHRWMRPTLSRPLLDFWVPTPERWKVELILVLIIYRDGLSVHRQSLGTNLIHDFTAVTFSVKLAFFREKRRFLWNPWFFVNFSTFSLIYDNSRVLSAAFVQMLLFATCRTSALSSWHWLSLCSKYSLFWNFFVCNTAAPRNNVCGAREFAKLFPWNLTHF